jgi:nitrogen fixation NifU-like protein
MHPKLIDHFQNPRNVGELPPPAVTVEVSNPVCGDILRLSVLYENGRPTAVRYKTRGCTASIAAGSALTELILAEASITPAAIEAAVGELRPESKHAAALCMDAVNMLGMKK